MQDGARRKRAGRKRCKMAQVRPNTSPRKSRLSARLGAERRLIGLAIIRLEIGQNSELRRAELIRKMLITLCVTAEEAESVRASHVHQRGARHHSIGDTSQLVDVSRCWGTRGLWNYQHQGR